MMKFLIVAIILGAIVSFVRIFTNLRKLREQRGDSFDAKLIERLRLTGSDPFKPHDVDFFFAMPNERAAQAVIERLVADGFTADYKRLEDHGEQPFSVHASKQMRLSVPDMQDTSRRFGALADQHGGRYDGWAASHVGRADDGGVKFRDR